MIDPDVIRLAQRVLTPKQLDVFGAHHWSGFSFREISRQLDISRSTVTDRYDNACRRLRQHGVRFTQDGRPYLEETTTA